MGRWIGVGRKDVYTRSVGAVYDFQGGRLGVEDEVTVIVVHKCLDDVFPLRDIKLWPGVAGCLGVTVGCDSLRDIRGGWW